MVLKSQEKYIAILDIGSSKIFCLIAIIDAKRYLRVAGVGHQNAQGVKAGVITDITKAEESIRAAVSQAEQMAGINIEKLVVNVPSTKQISHFINQEIHIKDGHLINKKDIKFLVSKVCEKLDVQQEQPLHAINLNYKIDGNIVTDPLKMYGNLLESDLHIMSIPVSIINNIDNCLANCELEAEEYVASNYASIFGCLSEDERNLGVLLIELGAGSTSLLICKNGSVFYSDNIGIGGIHITSDLAIGLATSIQAAERLKILYGSVYSSSSDAKEMIDVPSISAGDQYDTQYIHRNNIVEIIKPRVDELFEMIGDRLATHKVETMFNNVVITGGTSQLNGLEEYVRHGLKKPVRTGSAFEIPAMTENYRGPAFSCAVGMLKYYIKKNEYDNSYHDKTALAKFVGTVREWLNVQ